MNLTLPKAFLTECFLAMSFFMFMTALTFHFQKRD
ncbi:hypothetical protein BSNT_07702 [Bacillus subtilis subsp. natto BEST195]|nr:hypothetical protein BSNT_07702 [Bacillus subtilis subsp. natto BEST195]